MNITGNATDIGVNDNNIILVKFTPAGDVVWERIGGPGFGGGSMRERVAHVAGCGLL